MPRSRYGGAPAGPGPASQSGRLRQHPAEVATAEDMQVEVWHFLVPVAAAVGEDAVTGLGEALFARDPTRSPEQCRELVILALGREIVERHVGALRDYEDVYRR